MISLQSIASAVGGKIYGITVFAPGPNKPEGDRTLRIFVDTTDPDGFRVQPAVYTDYVRHRLGTRKAANGSVKASVGVKALESPLWADTSTWDSTPCPPREWAVRDRIPLRQVTLFSGEGAIGKSIVEMMLCVAHVLGKDWLGSLPEPGGAFYFGCEDDESEQRIRFREIAVQSKIEPGVQPDTDIREIQFKKSNYGRVADSMVLRYKNGLFLPEAGPSNIDKAAREAAVDDTFIAIAKKLDIVGEELSAAQTSHGYAATIIAKHPEAKDIRKAEFVAAMDRLLDQGRLSIETLRPGTTRQKKVIKVP